MNQGEWIKAKKAVAERDGGKCMRCFGVAADVHHRKPRGMGGTSDPEQNYGLDNLISLCRYCHDWAHAEPADAYACGFLVHSGDDPAEVPVVIAKDLGFMLTKDGRIEQTIFFLS